MAITPAVKKLLSPLRRLADHMLGVNRTDFRRLFLAASRGGRCWELDRLKIKTKQCTQELTDRRGGYWLPDWTWSIVADAFMREHLAKVARGEKSRIETAFRPPERKEKVEQLA